LDNIKIYEMILHNPGFAGLNPAHAIK